jgi:hypothetical protein
VSVRCPRGLALDRCGSVVVQYPVAERRHRPGVSVFHGIKMYRGNIQVDSTEGRSATFTVVLPVRLPNLGHPLETRATE